MTVNILSINMINQFLVQYNLLEIQIKKQIIYFKVYSCSSPIQRLASYLIVELLN